MQERLFGGGVQYPYICAGGNVCIKAPEMGLALSRNELAEVNNVYPASPEFWLH